MHGGQHVLDGRPVWTTWVGAVVITHDYLGSSIARIAFRCEELGHVGHILVAAIECMLGTDIVDADEERLSLQLAARI